MPTHRFAVNVPNPGEKSQIVDLRLEALKHVRGVKFRLPQGSLRIDHAGLSLDPCGDECPKTLKVKLKGHTGATITVVVVTAPGGKGAAAFHLVDRRGGKQSGGVTLACVEPPLVDPAGLSIPAAHPCPIVPFGKPYFVGPDSDPAKEPWQPNVTLGIACDLVVRLTNPTKAVVGGVQAYIEHLGGSDASFRPTTWNIGKLAPGDVFYATWRLNPCGSKTGTFQTSIVVSSIKKDATRLRVPIVVGTIKGRRIKTPARR